VDAGLRTLLPLAGLKICMLTLFVASRIGNAAEFRRELGGTDYKADPESGNECSRGAAFLTGNDIGSMIPTSAIPRTKPQIAPSRTLDMTFAQKMCTRTCIPSDWPAGKPHLPLT